MQPQYVDPSRVVPVRRPVRPLGGWRTASLVLICVTLLVGLLHVVADWAAVLTNPGAGLETVLSVLSWTTIGVQLVTEVVFLRWLWLARANAEAINPAPHRHGPIWVIAGWIVPVVCFWYPQAVVRDIWNASNPERPRGAPSLVATSGAIVVTRWWAAFVTSRLVQLVHLPVADAPRGAAVFGTISFAAYLLAAPLIITIITRITTWQSSPR